MKTKYEYEKPAVHLLVTQNLMEGEPGIHFGSGELNGDDEGEVLSKENDFFEEEKLPVQKNIWAEEE